MTSNMAVMCQWNEPLVVWLLNWICIRHYNITVQRRGSAMDCIYAEVPWQHKICIDSFILHPHVIVDHRIEYLLNWRAELSQCCTQDLYRWPAAASSGPCTKSQWIRRGVPVLMPVVGFSCDLSGYFFCLKNWGEFTVHGLCREYMMKWTCSESTYIPGMFCIFSFFTLVQSPDSKWYFHIYTIHTS